MASGQQCGLDDGVGGFAVDAQTGPWIVDLDGTADNSDVTVERRDADGFTFPLLDDPVDGITVDVDDHGSVHNRRGEAPNPWE